MTMPLNLVLVRHGQSEGNVAFNLLKSGDGSKFTPEFARRHTSTWRLTDLGIEQAKIAGQWLKDNEMSFYRHYASDYYRALETAAYLELPRARWFPEFYVRERDFGELDSYELQRRKEYFEGNHRSMDKFYWAPPNGESMAQVCIRVDRFLHTIHRECGHSSVIVVCHGDLMWAFRIRLERLYPRTFETLKSSSNPFDRIHNGQIIHYTRVDPESGEVYDRVNWMKSVCPNNLHLSYNKWNPIFRNSYTNDELLKLVSTYERVINE